MVLVATVDFHDEEAGVEYAAEASPVLGPDETAGLVLALVGRLRRPAPGGV